jgi:hypothetical protein
MAEQKPASFEELLKKVEEFEKTVNGLLENIKVFKKRLFDNKEKYGSDTAKWPTGK